MIQRIEVILEPLTYYLPRADRAYQLKVSCTIDDDTSIFTQVAGYDDFKSHLEIYMDMASRQIKQAFEQDEKDSS